MVFYPTWSPAEIDKVMEMSRAGYTAAEIGQVVGRSQEAVRKIRSRYNVDPGSYSRESTSRPRTPETDCILHLVDLMRMFSKSPDTTLAEAKAEYRACCELQVDPGYRIVTAAVQPYHVQRSYVGSQFADVV